MVLVDFIGSLSFDTSHERVIELGTGGKLGVAEADNAKARLKAALEVVLADVYKPASLVTEAAGARSLQELAPDNPVVDELRSLRERVEFLIRRAAAPEEGGLPSDSSALFEFISELESKARVGAYELEDFVTATPCQGIWSERLPSSWSAPSLRSQLPTTTFRSSAPAWTTGYRRLTSKAVRGQHRCADSFRTFRTR